MGSQRVDGMKTEMDAAEGAAGQFVRDAEQQEARILGRIIQCDGSRATVAVTAAGEKSHEAGYWSVGKLISVGLPNTRTVGLAHDIAIEGDWKPDGSNHIIVQMDLIGEVRDDPEDLPEDQRRQAEAPEFELVRITGGNRKVQAELSRRHGLLHALRFHHRLPPRSRRSLPLAFSVCKASHSSCRASH